MEEMQWIVGNNPCPVLLAIYTPSMEINVSKVSVRDANVAHTGKPPDDQCRRQVQ
jgi:hypothetical protein